MKLIDTTCPSCGATLTVDKEKGNVFCQYCGTQLLLDDEVKRVRYDDAEEAGYLFERGRQRALAEMAGAQSPQVADDFPETGDVTQSRSSREVVKKRKTWLWVLGWLFCFPIPLTILMLRNRRFPNAVRYAVIAFAWIMYIIMVIGAGD